MSWNWCQLLGKHDFWAKICSRAKIDRGGSRSPPRSWQGLSDVSLIRVKSCVLLARIRQFSNWVGAISSSREQTIVSDIIWNVLQFFLFSFSGSVQTFLIWIKSGSDTSKLTYLLMNSLFFKATITNTKSAFYFEKPCKQRSAFFR